MGISRDSRHKRRKTGGRMPIHQKKRAFEKARQPAMTKIGPKRVHQIRARGANLKFRALRLDSGNFSWTSESLAAKTRVLTVVYNATNNELVRTNTLTKNTIVEIDATPFKALYLKKYGVDIGKVKKEETATKEKTEKAALKWEEKKKKWEELAKTRVLEPTVAEEFKTGRLLAAISSRPGQSGRADGYILEGLELDFYKKIIGKKSKK
jgi:small subunit ribosomal protein S8e